MPIIQARSEPSYRSRIIASNNILNALFMVISAIGTVIMLTAGFNVTQVFFDHRHSEWRGGHLCLPTVARGSPQIPSYTGFSMLVTRWK